MKLILKSEKSQFSLEWLLRSIEKIDISIYQDRVKITYFQFLHTSKISNWKEWIFTLQRVKFQSFQSEMFNLFTKCSLSTISLDWNVFVFYKHKRESLERDSTEGTLVKRLKTSLWNDWNVTLCRVKMYSLHFEILLVWRKIDEFHSQFQKAITPLFVKIELLVPMCSVTPLVSWNQTIFTKKPFVSIIGISGILYCVIFVKI